MEKVIGRGNRLAQGQGRRLGEAAPQRLRAEATVWAELRGAGDLGSLDPSLRIFHLSNKWREGFLFPTFLPKDPGGRRRGQKAAGGRSSRFKCPGDWETGTRGQNRGE